MGSKYEDFVFLQAQEMFPQLDGDVIYMILSEHGFQINDALPSLTLLTPISTTGNCHQTENILDEKTLQEEAGTDKHFPGDELLSKYSVYSPYYSSSDVDAITQFSVAHLEKWNGTPSFSDPAETPSQPFVAHESETLSNAPENIVCNTSEDQHIPEKKLVDIGSERLLKKNDCCVQQFCHLISYISVGKLNGVWLSFSGNQQRYPIIKSHSAVVKVFKDLKEQLKSEHISKPFETVDILKHCLSLSEETISNFVAVVPSENLTLSTTLNDFDTNFSTVVESSQICRLALPTTTFLSLNASEHSQRKQPSDQTKLNEQCTTTSCLEGASSLIASTIANSTSNLNPHGVYNSFPCGIDSAYVPISVSNFDHTGGQSLFTEASQSSHLLYDSFPTMDVNHFQFRNASNQPRLYSYHPAAHYRSQQPYQQNLSNWNQSRYRQNGPRSWNQSFSRQFAKQTEHILKPSTLYTMYILRGAPGSGKSTLAKTLSNQKGKVLSTDNYFQTKQGYRFDPTALSEAHEWNKRETKCFLEQKLSPIIIDNTNMASWEMEPYMKMALEHGYEIIIAEPNTWWKTKVRELARRNSHNVPKEKIELMLSKYERNVSVESVLGKDLYQQYLMKCLNNPLKSMNATCKLYKKENPIQKDVPDKSIVSNLNSNQGKGSLVKSNVSNKQFPSNATSTITKEKFLVQDGSFNSQNMRKTRNNETNTFSTTNAFERNSTNKKERKQISGTSKNVSVDMKESSSSKECVNVHHKTAKIISIKSPFKSKNVIPKNEKLQCSSSISQGTGSKRAQAKSKKRTPSVQNESLIKSLSEAGDDWSSFGSMIGSMEGLSCNASPKMRNLDTTVLCKESVATETEERIFSIMNKINHGIRVEHSNNVLTSNSSHFIPATQRKSMKVTKVRFEKSTMTEDLKQNKDFQSDIETLRLLFTDYSAENLQSVYAQCDQNLQWTTDVIAESSLFGFSNNSGYQKDSAASLRLDDYYDSLCESQSCYSSKNNDSKSFSNSDSLQLKLSTDFVNALATIFGSGGCQIADCTINVDFDLARLIHNVWKDAAKKVNIDKSGGQSKQLPSTSLDSSYSSLALCEIFAHPKTSEEKEQLKKDEAYARRLQAQEKLLMKETRSPKSNRKQAQSSQSIYQRQNASNDKETNSKWLVKQSKTSDTLTQIMNDEVAAENAQQRQEKKLVDLGLATQLKREELRAMYDSIPAQLLDDIFAIIFCDDTKKVLIIPLFYDNENNFNLEDTMFVVNCIFCEDTDLFYKTGSLISSPSRPSLSTRKNTEENPALVKKVLTSKIVAKSVLDDTALTYDDIRTEANMQRQQMHECQRKAAIANHQKKGALAMYYAQQAHEHQKKLRQANQRAANLTYIHMNEGRSPNELDLHGLHVDEAIDTLRSVICERQQDPRNARHLFVITGRGINSASGIPRIKNAVLEWLKNKNFRFELLNEGYFKIFL